MKPVAGRWHGKALQPAELAIILEQRALGHGKELIKRALAREGFQRSTESVRGHLDAIKRREAEAQKQTYPWPHGHDSALSSKNET